MRKSVLTKVAVLLTLPLLAIFFWNCEKDDICDPATPVTSRLTIEFYDAIEQDELSPVTNLAIVEQNLTNADTVIFNNVSKINVPLNINSDNVKYTFISNYKNANPLLVYTDTLEFNYTRLIEYVSRACGYKTVFNLNNDSDLPQPFILNDNPSFTPGSWIKNIVVEEYNISNESETHVKIYY